VNYVGKLGRHQIIQFDQNPAIYDCSGGYFASNPTTYCADASTASSSYQARVLYPGYNYGGQGIVDNASVATSNYNGLQVIYRQRARKSVTALASYTYSRSLDLQSNGQTNQARVPMPFNLRSQYGPSDFQATHILNGGFIWNTPIVHYDSRLVRSIVNGWRVGGILNARSGNPINIYLAGDLSLTDERPQRPNLVPGANPNMPHGRSRPAQAGEWFNTAAFEDPALGTFGNVGRNSLYGPAFIVTNGTVGRFFQLTQEKDLEFKVDAFNLFNSSRPTPSKQP
jgi:hypothetical protein